MQDGTDVCFAIVLSLTRFWLQIFGTASFVDAQKLRTFPVWSTKWSTTAEHRVCKMADKGFTPFACWLDRSEAFEGIIGRALGATESFGDAIYRDRYQLYAEGQGVARVLILSVAYARDGKHQSCVEFRKNFLADVRDEVTNDIPVEREDGSDAVREVEPVATVEEARELPKVRDFRAAKRMMDLLAGGQAIAAVDVISAAARAEIASARQVL